MNLYESMAAHPDIAPVFDLLRLVDPVDEFSRALCLVRDCFDPEETLRTLSRDLLRDLLKQRTALLRAYETAVMDAAQVYGAKPKTFLEAATVLGFEFDTLRKAFENQVAELMGRPL